MTEEGVEQDGWWENKHFPWSMIRNCKHPGALGMNINIFDSHSVNTLAIHTDVASLDIW